jgi:hypothetical protein
MGEESTMGRAPDSRRIWENRPSAPTVSLARTSPHPAGPRWRTPRMAPPSMISSRTLARMMSSNEG